MARKNNQDYYKVAGSEVEDPDIAARSRARVTRQQGRTPAEPGRQRGAGRAEPVPPPFRVAPKTKALRRLRRGPRVHQIKSAPAPAAAEPRAAAAPAPMDRERGEVHAQRGLALVPALLSLPINTGRRIVGLGARVGRRVRGFTARLRLGARARGRTGKRRRSAPSHA